MSCKFLWKGGKKDRGRGTETCVLTVLNKIYEWAYIQYFLSIIDRIHLLSTSFVTASLSQLTFSQLGHQCMCVCLVPFLIVVQRGDISPDCIITGLLHFINSPQFCLTNHGLALQPPFFICTQACLTSPLNLKPGLREPPHIGQFPGDHRRCLFVFCVLHYCESERPALRG